MSPPFAPLCVNVKSGLLLVVTLFLVGKSYCSSKTPPYSTAPSPSNILEAIRYSPLPPTVFSPSGRLHNVEKNAKKASEDDESSSLILALRCYNGDIVVVCTSPSSPLVYHHDDDDESDGNGDEAEEDRSKDEYSAPLLFYQRHIKSDNNNSNEDNEEIGSIHHAARPSQASLLSQPLSILSSNLIAATGGDATDSSILLRRIQDVALNMNKFQNGGVMMDMAASQQGWVNRGGICSVQSASLARRIADSIQIPTQNVAGKGGKMLASSALIIGTDESKIVGLRNNRKIAKYDNHIWRIDPTGQFWSCDAAAVGRAAGVTEAILMRKIANWKKSQQRSTTTATSNNNTNDDNGEVDKKEEALHMDDIISNLSNADVRNYLERLSSNEALSIACQCITDATKRRNISINTSILQLHEHYHPQGIILHSSSSNRNIRDQSDGDKFERRCRPVIEVVNSAQMRQIMAKSET